MAEQQELSPQAAKSFFVEKLRAGDPDAAKIDKATRLNPEYVKQHPDGITDLDLAREMMKAKLVPAGIRITGLEMQTPTASTKDKIKSFTGPVLGSMGSISEKSLGFTDKPKEPPQPTRSVSKKKESLKGPPGMGGSEFINHPLAGFVTPAVTAVADVTRNLPAAKTPDELKSADAITMTGTMAQMGAGAAAGLADAGIQLTSIQNLALLYGTAGFGKLLQNATGKTKAILNAAKMITEGKFSIDLATAAASEVPEALEAFRKGDWVTYGRKISQAAADVLLVGKIGNDALKEAGIKHIRFAPEEGGGGGKKIGRGKTPPPGPDTSRVTGNPPGPLPRPVSELSPLGFERSEAGLKTAEKSAKDEFDRHHANLQKIKATIPKVDKEVMDAQQDYDDARTEVRGPDVEKKALDRLNEAKAKAAVIHGKGGGPGEGAHSPGRLAEYQKLHDEAKQKLDVIRKQKETLKTTKQKEYVRNAKPEPIPPSRQLPPGPPDTPAGRVVNVSPGPPPLPGDLLDSIVGGESGPPAPRKPAPKPVPAPEPPTPFDDEGGGGGPTPPAPGPPTPDRGIPTNPPPAPKPKVVEDHDKAIAYMRENPGATREDLVNKFGISPFRAALIHKQYEPAPTPKPFTPAPDVPPENRPTDTRPPEPPKKRPSVAAIKQYFKENPDATAADLEKEFGYEPEVAKKVYEIARQGVQRPPAPEPKPAPAPAPAPDDVAPPKPPTGLLDSIVEDTEQKKPEPAPAPEPAKPAEPEKPVTPPAPPAPPAEEKPAATEPDSDRLKRELEAAKKENERLKKKDEPKPAKPVKPKNEAKKKEPVPEQPTPDEPPDSREKSPLLKEVEEKISKENKSGFKGKQKVSGYDKDGKLVGPFEYNPEGMGQEAIQAVHDQMVKKGVVSLTQDIPKTRAEASRPSQAAEEKKTDPSVPKPWQEKLKEDDVHTVASRNEDLIDGARKGDRVKIMSVSGNEVTVGLLNDDGSVDEHYVPAKYVDRLLKMLGMENAPAEPPEVREPKKKDRTTLKQSEEASAAEPALDLREVMRRTPKPGFDYYKPEAFENAQWRYSPAKGGRPGMLWMDKKAMGLFYGFVQKVEGGKPGGKIPAGLSVSYKSAIKAVTEMTSGATFEGLNKAQKKLLSKFSFSIFEAANQSPTGEVMAVGASPYRSMEATKKTIRHETAHVKQQEVSRDPIISRQEMASIPGLREIARALEKRGYEGIAGDPGDLLHELMAFSLAGQHENLGVSEEMLDNALADVLVKVANTHGGIARDVLLEYAQPGVKARQKSARSATGSGDSGEGRSSEEDQGVKGGDEPPQARKQAAGSPR